MASATTPTQKGQKRVLTVSEVGYICTPVSVCVRVIVRDAIGKAALLKVYEATTCTTPEREIDRVRNHMQKCRSTEGQEKQLEDAGHPA